jgi:hypothetical protein
MVGLDGHHSGGYCTAANCVLIDVMNIHVIGSSENSVSTAMKILPVVTHGSRLRLRSTGSRLSSAWRSVCALMPGSFRRRW